MHGNDVTPVHTNHKPPSECNGFYTNAGEYVGLQRSPARHRNTDNAQLLDDIRINLDSTHPPPSPCRRQPVAWSSGGRASQSQIDRDSSNSSDDVPVLRPTANRKSKDYVNMSQSVYANGTVAHSSQAQQNHDDPTYIDPFDAKEQRRPHTAPAIPAKRSALNKVPNNPILPSPCIVADQNAAHVSAQSRPRAAPSLDSAVASQLSGTSGVSGVRADTVRRQAPPAHVPPSATNVYANATAPKLTQPVENEELAAVEARALTSSSDEGLRHCIVCNVAFDPAWGAKQKEEHVNACLATHNSGPDRPECPVCKRVFDADFPASKLTEHVNNHFADFPETEPYVMVSNSERVT